jgi:hypothetical protein
MGTITKAVIAAGMLWITPALAQPAQDHDAHHPETGTVQQQSQPATRPNTGMMGGAMMGGNAPAGMMGGSMMGQGQTGPAGMMQMMNMMMGVQPGADHIEGRLAFIKTELKITDAQAPQWNAFADALRSNANMMLEMRKSMMSGQGGATLVDRLALEDRAVTAHLAALKKTEDAVAKLYGVLTDEQKKIADGIVIGPMGMPMGMM